MSKILLLYKKLYFKIHAVQYQKLYKTLTVILLQCMIALMRLNIQKKSYIFFKSYLPM